MLCVPPPPCSTRVSERECCLPCARDVDKTEGVEEEGEGRLVLWEGALGVGRGRRALGAAEREGGEDE